MTKEEEKLKKKIEELRERFGNISHKHLWSVNEFNGTYGLWYVLEFGKFCIEETKPKVMEILNKFWYTNKPITQKEFKELIERIKDI